MIDELHKRRVNSDRMLAAFNELSQIGATGAALTGEAAWKRGGGLNRPTFSEAHLAARQWFREQIEKAGLEFRTDGAGNHSAVLASAGRVGGGFRYAENATQPSPPYRDQTLLLGSHLDSVPNGGRFAAALGVMAALEVLRTIKDAGLRPRLNLEAIDFTDEEGTLVGLLGSSAVAGHLRPEFLKTPRGGREALVAGMQHAGLNEEGMLKAARPKNSLAGYLELHIEQGK